MADQIQTPGEVYAQRVQNQIAGLSRVFLVKLVGAKAADQAAARIGLAMRQAALANPDIYAASPDHIANAISLCALLDLTVGGPNADLWMIPKATNGVPGLQIMMSHRGYRKLARRSGWEVGCALVHGSDTDPTGADFSNADDWAFRRNPYPTLDHIPHQTNPTWDTVVRAYCYFNPIGQREDWDVYILERNEIERRRKVAQTQAVWNAWPLEMALKTVIKAAAQRGSFPLDTVGRTAMEELDAEADDRPIINLTERPAPAPERTVTPPRRMTAVDDLEQRLGPDEESDQGRDPEPITAAPVEEQKKRTRGPNKPKESPAPQENAPADGDKLNAQNELLLRVQEAERKVGGDILKARTAHGIAPTLSAGQVVKQCPEAAVISYCRELES